MRRTATGVLALAVCLALPASQAAAVDLTGLKGLGGSAGTSLMIGDSEYRAHARPQFTGDAVFKYGINPSWVFVGMFGFGWNAYAYEESWLSDIELLRTIPGYEPKAQEKVTTLSPFVVGAEYRFGTGETVPYIGAGGGVYMSQVLFNRSVGIDPRNGARHRSFNFGLYGRLGIEHFLSDVMSIDYDALIHIVFSEDRELFPDPTGEDLATYGRDFKTYGGDIQNIQVRVGLRYYWGGGV